MAENIPEPGRILKTLRASRQWSLTQVAAYTGVSKAMLGQIERGESSPTVATLWKIATGFNVPFSWFITPAEPENAEVIRSAEKRRRQQKNVAMQVCSLFPFDLLAGFDMLVIELTVGGLSESSAHEQGVIEHVVVIEGELQLAIGTQWHTLKAEEGMRFQADVAHSYRNSSEMPVRFYSLIHYPQAGAKELRTLP